MSSFEKNKKLKKQNKQQQKYDTKTKTEDSLLKFSKQNNRLMNYCKLALCFNLLHFDKEVKVV